MIASTKSRVSWLLVSLHAAWFFLAVANMSPPDPGFGAFLDQGSRATATLLAGRPFHWEYESVFLKLLVLVDTPAMLGAISFNSVLLVFARPFHLGFYQWSYLDATLLFLAASCQWLLIGHRFDRWLIRKWWGNWPRQQVHRWLGFLVGVILVVTLILTPIINGRSRHVHPTRFGRWTVTP